MAMAAVGDGRRVAAVRAVLRRAISAEDDAFAKRCEMRGRDRRLREKQTGDQRRKHARAQLHSLKNWSHRRLSVSKVDVRFRSLARSSKSSMGSHAAKRRYEIDAGQGRKRRA